MKKPKRGSTKPAIKMRHLKTTGRSAFPQQAAAFGPPDPASAPAFDPGPPVAAGQGVTGE